MSTSLMREFTGPEEEAATWAAAGVNDRDQRTIPPVVVA
jgi:hypothetical protein